MLSLHRQRLFRNRHGLRCHRKGQMADNGADSVLVPVIDGEVWAATGFKPREVSEVNPRAEIVFSGGGFAGVAASALLLSAGKPKLAATIPNKRCGQK